MYLTIILVLIFLACVGFQYAEGMWSTCLRFLAVLAAAILAMNYFEPIANQLDVSAAEFHVLLGLPRALGPVRGVRPAAARHDRSAFPG